MFGTDRNLNGIADAVNEGARRPARATVAISVHAAWSVAEAVRRQFAPAIDGPFGTNGTGPIAIGGNADHIPHTVSAGGRRHFGRWLPDLVCGGCSPQLPAIVLAPTIHPAGDQGAA